MLRLGGKDNWGPFEELPTTKTQRQTQKQLDNLSRVRSTSYKKGEITLVRKMREGFIITKERAFKLSLSK